MFVSGDLQYMYITSISVWDILVLGHLTLCSSHSLTTGPLRGRLDVALGVAGWKVLSYCTHAVCAIVSHVQACLVHTTETIRVRYFMDRLLEHRRPVMLVGNAGTGKSVLVGDKLGSLDAEKYMIKNVPFNYYTTSAMLQGRNYPSVIRAIGLLMFFYFWLAGRCVLKVCYIDWLKSQIKNFTPWGVPIFLYWNTSHLNSLFRVLDFDTLGSWV